MKPIPPLLAIVSALSLPACGGAGGVTLPDAPTSPAAYAPDVDHAYFPLASGLSWSYDGDEDGRPATEDVTTLPDPEPVMGIPCTVVRSEIRVEGRLVEVTLEWYAQDLEGNVWKFGEESQVPVGDVLAPTEDSWRAGEDGRRAWIAISGTPRPGERLYAAEPNGIAEFLVRSLDGTAAVPFGTFDSCLEVLESPDDPEDQDIILYGPGVGRVMETSPNGSRRLVAVTPPPGP